MNWFKRHLNWTLLLAYVLIFSVIGCAAWTVKAPVNLIYAVISLGLGVWVLKQKGRRMHFLWWSIAIALALSLAPQRGYYNDLSSYVGATLGQWSLPVIIWLCLKNKKQNIVADSNANTSYE